MKLIIELIIECFEPAVLTAFYILTNLVLTTNLHDPQVIHISMNVWEALTLPLIL